MSPSSSLLLLLREEEEKVSVRFTSKREGTLSISFSSASSEFSLMAASPRDAAKGTVVVMEVVSTRETSKEA